MKNFLFLKKKPFNIFKCKICWQITLSLIVIIVILETFLFLPFYSSYRLQQIKQFETKQIHTAQILLSILKEFPKNVDFNKILSQSDFVGASIYTVSGDKLKSIGAAPNLTPFDAMRLKPIYSRFYRKDPKGLYAFWDQKDLNAPFKIIAVINSENLKVKLKDFFIFYLNEALIILLVTLFASLSIIYFWLIRPIREAFFILSNSETSENYSKTKLYNMPKNELGYIFKIINKSFNNLEKNILMLKEKNKIISQLNIELDNKVKARTHELEQTNQALNSIALLPEENNNPVFRVNENGKILYANRMCQKLFTFWQCEKDSRIPKAWADLIPAILKESKTKQLEVSLEDQIYLLNFVPINTENYVNVYGFDITEQKLAENANKFLRNYNPITKLYNKSAFKFILEEKINEHSKGLTFDLLFLQINDITIINQNLGHRIGDIFLKVIAESIKLITPDYWILSHFSQNIFAIATFSQEKPLDPDCFAIELINFFTKLFEIETHRLRTSVNIGIARYPADSKNIDELFKFSDMALLHAVSHGTNTYHYYTEQISTALTTRHSIYQALYEAVQHQQLLLYYQPQLELKTNKITGAEALIRWQHPEKGLMSPIDFIEILENTSLVYNITEWLFESAIQFHITINKLNLGQIKLAVNLTSQQLYQENLLPILNKLLTNYEFNPNCIEIEITERTSLAEPEKTMFILKKLRDLGFKIALDDFGAEYSSLIYLQKLPIDKIKIDKRFTESITENSNNSIITKAIIRLAKELHLLTLVEGVETVSQKEILSQFDCDEIQGYLISEPLPENLFIKLMEKLKGE